MFASHSSTLLDRSSTRIVIAYSPSVDGVSQSEMETFVDSFTEVAPSTIGSQP